MRRMIAMAEKRALIAIEQCTTGKEREDWDWEIMPILSPGQNMLLVKVVITMFAPSQVIGDHVFSHIMIDDPYAPVEQYAGHMRELVSQVRAQIEASGKLPASNGSQPPQSLSGLYLPREGM